jgi:hypothetical protein
MRMAPRKYDITRTDMDARESDRRHGRRLPLRTPVFVRSPSWGTIRRLHTTDVSESGVCVESHESLEIGATIQVVVVMPDASRVRVPGEVRHASAKGDRWLLGVRLDPDVQDRVALRQFVSANVEPDSTLS